MNTLTYITTGLLIGLSGILLATNFTGPLEYIILGITICLVILWSLWCIPWATAKNPKKKELEDE